MNKICIKTLFLQNYSQETLFWINRGNYTKNKKVLFFALTCIKNHLGATGFPNQVLKDGTFGVALHWNAVYFICVQEWGHRFWIRYVCSSGAWYGAVANAPPLSLGFAKWKKLVWTCQHDVSMLQQTRRQKNCENLHQSCHVLRCDIAPVSDWSS